MKIAGSKEKEESWLFYNLPSYQLSRNQN